MPLEVEDVIITSESIPAPRTASRNPIQAASIAHTALQTIMTDVVENLFAVKNTHLDASAEGKPCVVSSLENKCLKKASTAGSKAWWLTLIYTLERITGSYCLLLKVSRLMIRSLRFQLQVAHAHARIFLYRPFLHNLVK